MSTIERVPISYFVYSSLSFFGRQCGGELPGTWFVRAIGDAGRDLAAIRQTLYRMEAEEELVSRKVGRVKYYSASTYAHGEIDAGLERILGTPDEAWDKRWTFVHLGFGHMPLRRVARERVVALMSVEGFAHLGGDVYVHPRDVGERIAKALSASARPHVAIVTGPLVNVAVEPSLVALWKIDTLGERYRAARGRLQALEADVRSGVSDRDAFVLRFAVVFEFLQVAWDDPRLPREVLPPDWPGDGARALAARLYRKLIPGATRYAQALLRDVSPPSTRSRRRVTR